MDFELPTALTERLAELDAFVERELRPLQEQDDHERFFDLALGVATPEGPRRPDPAPVSDLHGRPSATELGPRCANSSASRSSPALRAG